MILGGTIPETGKNHLITLTAHNFFYNCSVKIVLCSNYSLIYVLYSNIKVSLLCQKIARRTYKN